MFIDYAILGIICLATLIWAFYTLPEDDAPTDDNGGGPQVGGDSSPSDTPPALVNDAPEDEAETTLRGDALDEAETRVAGNA